MYFDLSDYQFPFFSQISASTVSKQITRNHFGLNFEADSDRTVFRVLPKNQSAVRMIHFSSLMSVLLLLTSVAERAGCDDAECLDEKQVFVQLRSELRDPKDSDPRVAAHPRWRWRRRWRRRNRRLRTTSPVCNVERVSGANTTFVFSAGVNTTLLLEVDAEEAAGCCISDRVDIFVLLGPPIVFEGLAVFLEPPNMPSQPVGFYEPGDPINFLLSSSSFQGAVAGGVWKLRLQTPEEAVGWNATVVSNFQGHVTQC